MKHNKVLLTHWQKRVLYGTTALLWLSGAWWLYYKYFGQIQGEYGIQAHPMQPVLLQIHGAAAMAFLIILGTLLIQHVPAGWNQKRQRPSGVSLLALCGMLIVTGWGLYYVGNQTWRTATSVVHWIVGLLFPVIIIFHVWLGRRRSMKGDRQRP